jgi:uncharacterized repeat protein (TIGR01451 family)
VSASVAIVAVDLTTGSQRTLPSNATPLEIVAGPLTPIPTVNLGVEIAPSPDVVVPGGTFTYTIYATASSPVSNAALDVTVPTGTNLSSIVAPAGWACVGPRCTTGLFSASGTFTVAMAVPDTLRPVDLTGGASIDSDVFDRDATNNTAMVNTFVRSPASIAISSIVPKSGPAFPGESIEWTITLKNNGPETQLDNPGDEFIDDLPSAIDLLSATATSGSVTKVGNSVHWSGSIAPGKTVTISMVSIIRSSTSLGSIITNVATVLFDSSGFGINDSSSTARTSLTIAAQVPAIQPLDLVILASAIGIVALFALRR